MIDNINDIKKKIDCNINIILLLFDINYMEQMEQINDIDVIDDKLQETKIKDMTNEELNSVLLIIYNYKPEEILRMFKPQINKMDILRLLLPEYTINDIILQILNNIKTDISMIDNNKRFRIECKYGSACKLNYAGKCWYNHIGRATCKAIYGNIHKCCLNHYYYKC